MKGRPSRLGLAAFSALPLAVLPASCRVDFLHLLFLSKPCVRIRPAKPGSLDELRAWSERNGYALCFDGTYACLAPDEQYGQFVLELDRSPEKHERDLGLLLGYPPCCCTEIERVGESLIDDRAELAAAWFYPRGFAHINPSGYAEGRSLVCHVPCSPTCSASVSVATAALNVIRRHRRLPAFRSWEAWL